MWTARKPSCPTCRAPVWSVTRDAEFALLIGAECTISEAPAMAPACAGDDKVELGATRAVKVPAPAGLTVANSSAGCVVTKVVRGNGGHVAGVRVGDLVLAVNGTCVRDHQQCVDFIEQRCRVGDCELSIKPGLAAMLRHGTGALLRGLVRGRAAAPRRAAEAAEADGGHTSGSASGTDESPERDASPHAA